MLLRDVANLRDFFGKFAPELLSTDYGPEIWTLYQKGVLSTELVLSGHFDQKTAEVDLGSVLREIDDARAEEAARRQRMITVP
jgi:RIO kinase 1